MVRADVIGWHAAEDLIGLVWAATSAARCHESAVGDHVGLARRIVHRRCLHVSEHLRRTQKLSAVLLTDPELAQEVESSRMCLGGVGGKNHVGCYLLT